MKEKRANALAIYKSQLEEEAESKKVKKYSIAELMAGGDSSDDEMYTGDCKLKE